jgi:predicted Fe-Mo cluster-binding NifX family protein
MRIAVTATAPQLDAPVDPRFGRCPYFLIVETDTLSFEAVENSNQGLGQGAGIQSARLVADRGVRSVLTGNCGPKAHEALTAAGISVVVGCSGTARQVVEQFNAGQLQPAAAANVGTYSGFNPSGAVAPSGTNPANPQPDLASPQPPAPANAPMTPGPGMGRGRGGMGCGMGRGRGPGGGGGRGGRGRGNCGRRGGP